jgi:tetratricopeptide (TPR) repeat protein
LDIRTTDPDIRDTQFRIARMREAAQFGLETVGPADSEYTSDIEAEYNFFEGMSYLFSAMYFSGLPQEELGEIVGSTQNYQDAIASFDAAIALNPKPEYYLAKARANYYLGNKAEAVSAATAALDLDEDFARAAMYDAANGPTNTMENALFGRATFDDFQPLPTLDFLDPKYSFLSAAEDPSVYYLKAEEAHLILAEANATDGSIALAQTNLENLVDLVDSREVRIINDATEGRTQVEPGSRPNNSSVVVNGRSGLVLDRNSGEITVSPISGTSLSDADIASITTEDEALKLIYRTRQEVFIAEGLRFVDMGIKLVVTQNEILQNPNVSEGDASTIPVIPSFIESVISDLDAINYDATAGVATTVINVTDILVANKTSDLVLPFN